MIQKDNLELGKEPSSIRAISDTDNVKKLNRNPILIISFVLVVLVLALLYVAGTRSAPTVKMDGGTETSTGNGEAANGNFVNQLSERPQSKMIGEGSVPPMGLNDVPPAPMSNDPLSDPFAAKNGNVPQQNGQNGNTPPLANGNGNVTPPPNPFEEFRKEQAMKRLKAGYTALETPSKTGISTDTMDKSNPTNSMTPKQREEADRKATMDGYMQKVLAMGSGAGAGMGSGMGSGAGAGGVYDNTKSNNTFLAESPSYDYLSSKKTAQLDPFEVKTGTVIPAVLITGVNSELPGKMKAQISENIYDTATGKYLLIPQGSVLVGDYSSGVVYGQKRVLTAWNRIIFPDGKTLNIGNMGGTDREGFSGFQDEVDNHYMRIFGSAFMMGAITGGIAYSAPTNNTGTTVQTPSDQMIASMIAQLGQVGIQMIQKNMNVAPTLTIRAGYKFNVFVTKDMRLEPLKMKLR